MGRPAAHVPPIHRCRPSLARADARTSRSCRPTLPTIPHAHGAGPVCAVPGLELATIPRARDRCRMGRIIRPVNLDHPSRARDRRQTDSGSDPSDRPSLTRGTDSSAIFANSVIFDHPSHARADRRQVPEQFLPDRPSLTRGADPESNADRWSTYNHPSRTGQTVPSRSRTRWTATIPRTQGRRSREAPIFTCHSDHPSRAGQARAGNLFGRGSTTIPHAQGRQARSPMITDSATIPHAYGTDAPAAESRPA